MLFKNTYNKYNNIGPNNSNIDYPSKDNVVFEDENNNITPNQINSYLIKIKVKIILKILEILNMIKKILEIMKMIESNSKNLNMMKIMEILEIMKIIMNIQVNLNLKKIMKIMKIIVNIQVNINLMKIMKIIVHIIQKLNLLMKFLSIIKIMEII